MQFFKKYQKTLIIAVVGVALFLLGGSLVPNFLKLGNLVIETYQNGRAVGQAGAVDHIAINVTDVDAARRIADEMVLQVIEAGQLPFWSNGVKYFTILGPNQEKLEFNQYL